MASKSSHVRKINYEYTGDINLLQEELMLRGLAEQGYLFEALRHTVTYYLMNDYGMRFNGTGLNDTIIGGLGDDILSGKGGDDVLLGAGGDDALNGGNGNDTLYGDAGDDTLTGGNGDDTLVGGSGMNTLDGGEGIDTAVYEGYVTDYEISYAGPNLRIKSTTEPFINDTLINIEYVQFDFTRYASDYWLGGEPTVDPTPSTLPLNIAPVAADDSFSVLEDQSLQATVLANDVDADGDALTAIAFSGVSAGGGSVTMQANGSFVYTPALHFSGADSFEYTVSDGNGGTSTAAVNLAVTGVADAPVLSVPGSVEAAYTAENTALSVALDISAALTDNDGSETLSVRVSGLPTGATLSAGAAASDGSWVLAAGDIAGVTLDLPPGTVDDFQLAIVAEAQETAGGAIAISDGVVNVNVTAWLAETPSEPAPEPDPTPTEPLPEAPQEIVEVNGSPTDAAGQVIYHAPDASAVDGLVGMTFANNSASASSGGYVTFGQVFKQGDLGAADGLTLLVNGVASSVQVDVKATWDDGSVKHAVLTTAVDPLDAGQHQDAFLKIGTAASGTTPVLADLLASGYDFSFDVDLYDALGVKTDTAAINVQDLLADPAGNGIVVTNWLEGPYVSEFSFQYQPDGVEGLEYRVDIRLYEDGTTRTDFSIANEHSFSVSETIIYDVVLQQDGGVVFSEALLEHHRNSNWHEQFWTGDHSDAHLQFDIDYMAESGAIPHYETSHGVASNSLNDDLDANFGAMESGTIRKSMPSTGGRDDIGLFSEWTSDYLVSQDERAEYVMMGNADAAGSAPWHFIDEATGDYINLVQRSELWIDYRHKDGTDALTSTFTHTLDDTGWKVDNAHQPSLSFVPYLISGDQYHLNNLVAQATYTIGRVKPNWRDNIDSGALFVDGAQQVRATAWSIRTVTDAAFILPDGHVLETMFDTSVEGSLDLLIKKYITNGIMDEYGELEGFIRDPLTTSSGSDEGRTSPWTQDYVVNALGLAASRGYEQAVDMLDWTENFLTGRFNTDEGMSPYFGSSYRYQVRDATTGEAYTTWTELAENSFEKDLKTGFGTKSGSGTSYISSALAALTTLVTHVASADALDSYGFLIAEAMNSGAYNVSNDSKGYSVDTKWFMMPKMGDGTYLDILNVHTGGSMQGSDDNELLYGDELGNTISGGGGLDWLYGSHGDDVVNGEGGNDWLFGGFGTDELRGGSGDDHLKGGADGDSFIYAVGANGDDVIEDFNPALDQLILSAGLGDGSLTFTELMQSSVASVDGLLLDIGGGDSILLKGLIASDLSLGNVDILG